MRSAARPSFRLWLRACAAVVACAGIAGCAAAPPIDLDERALAAALASKPVVLLGEVHDNAAQHATRAAALRELVRGGARPAFAFEQFDRERQADIERARRETPPAGTTRADRLIALAAAPRSGWNWAYYRPYLELALEFDLPIVAANLSRADAERVAKQGYEAVFDAAAIAALGLDALPPALLAEQQRAVDVGHCRSLPAERLPQLARAQIARDAAMARAIRPYFTRGVVLLTGNGHAREIGVPHFLSGAERARTVTIGLLEAEHAGEDTRARFDVVFVTPTQPRADPCAALKR